MTLPALQDIQNDTGADAVPVQFNFQTLETYINTEVISRDGSVQMTGPLILSDGQPAASAAAVSGSVPIGSIVDYIVASEPTNWKLCNGQILSTAEFPELEAIIGETFNLPGDSFGGAQFRLPDLRSRVAVGYDPGTAPFDTVGASADQADWELVQHAHSIGHGHSNTVGNADADHTHLTPAHTHETQLQHTAWANRLISGGGGTSIALAQENIGGEVSWSASGIRQAASSGGGTSTGQSQSHKHTVTINDHVGNSGNAGSVTTLTNKNYPPYIVVTKLMKVK